MRLLVCGPRDCTDDDAVWNAISGAANVGEQDEGDVTLIVGDATGVDAVAREWAAFFGHSAFIFVADWKKFGRAGGPKRNQLMIDTGKPTQCLAFQYKDRQTPGTQDMIRRARAARIPVEIVEINPKGERP